MGRPLWLAALLLASLPASAELPARVPPAASFRPVTARQAIFLTAVDNWTEVVPKDPADKLYKRHAPELEEIRAEASTKEAAKAMGPIEERFEGWKKAFLKDLYERTHYDFFSDPKRFEMYMEERLALIEELKARERRSFDRSKLNEYDDLKARVGEAPDQSTLDRVFDRLGLKRKPLLFAKTEEAPKNASPKSVVFSEARRISPETLSAPPPPLVNQSEGHAAVRAHLIEKGVRKDIVDAVFAEADAQGADPLLLLAVIKTESYFNPRATSPANARGLMQLIDPTARSMGISNPAVNSYDPYANIKGGTKFLTQLWAKFVPDIRFADLASEDPWTRDDVKRVIASYNAGPGNAYRWQKIKETSDYVPRVLKFYTEYRRIAAEAGGAPPSA